MGNCRWRVIKVYSSNGRIRSFVACYLDGRLCPSDLNVEQCNRFKAGRAKYTPIVIKGKLTVELLPKLKELKL